MTQDKLRLKQQLKQIERDKSYYMEHYDLSEDEALFYLEEIYKIRYSIVNQKAEERRKATLLKDESPF